MILRQLSEHKILGVVVVCGRWRSLSLACSRRLLLLPSGLGTPCREVSNFLRLRWFVLLWVWTFGRLDARKTLRPRPPGGPSFLFRGDLEPNRKHKRGSRVRPSAPPLF